MSTASPTGSRSEKNFFAKLFDFSFEEFITISLIKVIYAIFVALAGLAALATLLGVAAQGGAAIVLGLILVPIVFLLYVVMARVWLEFVIVVFRVADHTSNIEHNTGASRAAPEGAPRWARGGPAASAGRSPTGRGSKIAHPAPASRLLARCPGVEPPGWWRVAAHASKQLGSEEVPTPRARSRAPRWV